MSRSISHIIMGLALLTVFASGAPAQDAKKLAKEEAAYRERVLQKAEEEYQRAFKKPETPAEFWTAMNFEIKVGQFGLAAQFLKGLLEATKDNEKELLQIEEAEGMSAFLRLRNVASWVDDPNLDKQLRDKMNKEASQLAAMLKRFPDPGKVESGGG